MGQVITFYSYKGGVGRTMALANVGVLLSQWGYKVLMIDWDLEAPGLEYFYQDYLDVGEIEKQQGIIDLLYSLKLKKEKISYLTWDRCIVEISIPEVKGILHLITAGEKTKDDNRATYFKKVREMDFHTFYEEYDGGRVIEDLREEWKRAYDFILIDSRTGITDIAGITTVHLPDVITLFLTTTEQSLNGSIDLIEKAKEARQKLPFERLMLGTVPILSRFDLTKEFDIGQEWISRFAAALSDFYDDWLPKKIKNRDILELTKIPYIARFSFGESLPVIKHGTSDPQGIGYSYETLAGLLANNLEHIDELVENRSLFIRNTSKIIKTSGATKPTIFISYSHKDEIWKDRLMAHLNVLYSTSQIDIWDDRRISSGDAWFDEIRNAISDASIGICLISADYLSSDFIIKEEIPYLFERRVSDNMMLIPILIRPCPWRAVPWLKDIEMLPGDGKSVSADFRDDWDTIFSKVAELILAKNKTSFLKTMVKLEPSEWPLIPEDNVSIDYLPVTGAELFGRQKEMELLDKAWDEGKLNAVSFVAWGGVGKSTLINKWLESMKVDNFRGAQRVFGWSFYSQGTGEKVTSADLFIKEGLMWFGDPNPEEGSPWDKGQRLASLVRRERTLLILDGLESLQSSHDFGKGNIKDQSLSVLVSELCRDNFGLLVITTREEVAEFKEYGERVLQINLEHITSEAGRALLRTAGVRGTDRELEAASLSFGNHALAINLLASYVREMPGHHISHGNDFSRLDLLEREGKFNNVLTAFAKKLGDSPEIEVLKLLGLFYYPADEKAIRVLIGAPVIIGLTDHLCGIDEAAWQRVIRNLRQLNLVAEQHPYDLGIIDCHPIIREHFGEQLKTDFPDAWREANRRLYEYFNNQPPELPDTLEEMAPLFRAVTHGCAAGRHQETMDEVYWKRIRRGNEAYTTRKLGAFGADLACLSSFFKEPWCEPVEVLSADYRAGVLAIAGFNLSALGRLREAAEPMQSGMAMSIAQADWNGAAQDANNLSELFLSMGELHKAIEFAEKGMEFADKSGDTFLRMITHTTHAGVLHQVGKIEEAEHLFIKAAEMCKRCLPEYPYLYSVHGFAYCGLLLEKGHYHEVLERVGQTLESSIRNKWLLNIALDNLSLGRGHMLKALKDGDKDYSESERYLNESVEGLRKAGQQQYMPLGLMARAELYRIKKAFLRANYDLDEAMTIATRGGMRLYEADCHLEYVRLCLAEGDKEKAKDHLSIAKRMIEGMGYHRRDKDVKEIEVLLG
ncbi:MAG: TIR domain-containing protein [Nitrospirae bacterium]|nr:TIR domain-containing protein [Nitrospirota bacterium]